MITYKSNELYSSTQIVKNFSSITSKLMNKEIEKIGILKNNKLDFIILKSQDFEDIVQSEVKKILFEKDLKNLQAQISKLKHNKAVLYSFDEVENILEDTIKQYEN